MAEAASWGALREVKKEPEEAMEDHWKAQWQEFRERLQPNLRRWEEPVVSDAALWDDAKAFLASFEQVAKACKWPRGEWAAWLLPALSGLAEEAFRSLEAQDREDYGKVKAAILRAEALRMEKQRQHFRHFSCQEVGDPRRLQGQLQELCHRWLRPERHSKEQILELLILEQFLASLPSELQGWIREGGPGTCSQAVALAEDFLRSQQGAERTELQIVEKSGDGGRGGSEGAGKGVSRVQAELMAKAAGWGAPQEVKKEPEEGLEAHWETQWHEFLEKIQPDVRRWEEPVVSDAALWDDAKDFLTSFEQVAQACKWPRGEWAAWLLPALSGPAEEAFRSLEAQDREDYGKVKAAILRAEALRMEKQRQHFRHFSCPEEVGDPRRLHGQLQELCHRWLRPERHSKEQILELLILEQFLASLPSELQGWIRAGGPGTCSQAVALAEDFLQSQQGAERTELQGLTTPMDVCRPLLQGNQDPTQPGNQTIFQEDGENTDSLDAPKGSQIKMEKSLWRGNELVDIPGTATQASNVNLLKRIEISAEGRGPTEHMAAESDNECNDFRDHLTATICQPSKIHTREEKTMSPKRGRRRYPWESEPDRRHARGNHNECATAEGTLQQNAYSDKQQGVVTEAIQSEFMGNVEGDQDSRESGESQEIQSEGRLSECSQCGKHFLQRRNVTLHQKTHTDVMPNKCGECIDLGDDVIIHQDIPAGARTKLHTCPQCGRSFRHRKALEIHQWIHTGEKPYKCSQCGKCFNRKGNLMNHWRTHTGEKPYECPDCGKRFSRRDCLKDHQRIHTGEKPFRCPKCGKNFSRSDGLSRHQKTHWIKAPESPTNFPPQKGPADEVVRASATDTDRFPLLHGQ